MPVSPCIGPGGVGNSADNLLWLRADEGITDADGAELTGWTDQSGNGNAPTSFADAPTYSTNALNGLPVVEFDGGDELPLPAALDGVSNGDNTIIVVSRRTGAGQDQFIWDQGQRVLGYEIKAGPATFNPLSASGKRDQGGPGGTKRATSSASGATAFNVISSMVDTSPGDIDLVVNGSVNTGDGGRLAAIR